jgi:nucleotide-binding universal stress UspA family protein
MTVLVAYDGSESAREAIEYAIERHGEEKIVLLRVVEAAGGTTTATIELAQETIRNIRDKVESETSQEVADMLDEAGVEFDIEVVAGDPTNEVVEFAEDHDDIDLVVVGSHGRGGISRMLLGSVAERIVRQSPVPVTVVR